MLLNNTFIFDNFLFSLIINYIHKWKNINYINHSLLLCEKKFRFLKIFAFQDNLVKKKWFLKNICLKYVYIYTPLLKTHSEFKKQIFVFT